MATISHTLIEPIPVSFADAYRRYYPPGNPPNIAFEEIFYIGNNQSSPCEERYVSKTDKFQVLMLCDGACINNGMKGSITAGGCGVVLSPPGAPNAGPSTGAYFEFPLETTRGIVHTSNRAELYSAILGLGLRNWRRDELFERIVVAMDSEYVVLGICERIREWIQRGWRTASGKPVANRDLWERLLGKLRELERGGCHVQFWKIPRDMNFADEFAKNAAYEALNNRMQEQ